MGKTEEERRRERGMVRVVKTGNYSGVPSGGRCNGGYHRQEEEDPTDPNIAVDGD